MYLTIETAREGYTPEQCGHTMTVGDLIDYLSQFDEDMRVVLSNDNGYTFGGIRWDSFNELGEEDEDEE